MKAPLLLTVLIGVCLVGCCGGGKVVSSSAQKGQEMGLVGLGKGQFERGDLEAAAKTLLACLRADPQNAPARYYLNLVREAEVQRSLNKRDPGSRFWYPTVPPRPVG